MNKAEFLFEIYKYLKVWSFDVWVWLRSSSRHSKDDTARILLKLLSGVFNLKEMHTTRVVLIFSQSWSSHGLEVKSSFRQGGRNLKVVNQSLSIITSILSFGILKLSCKVVKNTETRI